MIRWDKEPMINNCKERIMLHLKYEKFAILLVILITATTLGAFAQVNHFEEVPADKYKDGFSFTRVRNDLARSYLNAYLEVKSCKGAILTSSGGKRDLSAPVTPGRSRTSLHYLGRAIDLYIYTGMVSREDKYIIVRDGGTDEHPLWKVYCRVDDPKITPVELMGNIWKKGQEPETFEVKTPAICITDIMEKNGWGRITSRNGWKNEYLCMEWWHFQNEQGLEQGRTTFMEELEKIYSHEDIIKSPLAALNAIWKGHGFKLQTALEAPR